MGADFQDEVKKDFSKQIELERMKSPLFPELLDDFYFYWKSKQTGKIFKLAKHSFRKDRTTYYFFDELRKLQENKFKMAHINIVV